MVILRNGDACDISNYIDRSFGSTINLRTVKEELLENCDSATGWTCSSGATVLTNATYVYKGTNSIRVYDSGVSTMWGRKTFTSPKDLSFYVGTATGFPKRGMLSIPLKLECSTSSIEAAYIQFYDGTNTITYNIYTGVSTSGDINREFQPYYVPLYIPHGTVSTSFNWANVVYITIGLTCYSSSTLYIYVDDIKINSSPGRNRTTLHNCDSATDWTASVGAIAASSTQYIEGTNSLRCTADGSGNFTAVYAPGAGQDVSSIMGVTSGTPTNKIRLGFWFRYDDAMTDADQTIRIGSDSSNYLTASFNILDYVLTDTVQFLDDYWYYFEFDVRTMTKVGTPVWTAMDYIYLDLNIGTSDLAYIDWIHLASEEVGVGWDNGTIIYKGNTFAVTAGNIGTTSLLSKFVIATLNDSTNVATISAQAYGTALTYDQVPLAFVDAFGDIEYALKENKIDNNYFKIFTINNNEVEGGAANETVMKKIIVPSGFFKKYVWIMADFYTSYDAQLTSMTGYIHVNNNKIAECVEDDLALYPMSAMLSAVYTITDDNKDDIIISISGMTVENARNIRNHCLIIGGV